MPGWLDNQFHSHGKRELVTVAVDGLLARAISRSTDLLTDGFVESSWVDKQLQRGERKRVLELAVRHRILEPLPAGDSRLTRGRPRTGLRKREVTVMVGPFEVDGFLVHDFLDCNRSREEVEARRKAESTKKRTWCDKGRQQHMETPAEIERRRREAWDGVGDGSILGGPSSHTMSTGESTSNFEVDSRDRDREEPPPVEQTASSDARVRTRSADPVVQDVLDILAGCQRLQISVEGVENAVFAYRDTPGADPVKAAREVVTLATSPTHWLVNAARLMWQAFERQTTSNPPAAMNGRRGRNGRSAADGFQALKGAAR